MENEPNNKNIILNAFLYSGHFLVISFSIICYFIFTYDLLYPWIFFILSSSMTCMASFLVYRDLSKKYPIIIYPDDDYKPTKYQKASEFFVLIALIISFLGIGVLSAFYIVNFNSIFGVYIMHLIFFDFIIFTTLIFLREATTDYSGHSYHAYRQTNNTGEKIPYHWLPSTLPSEEMEKFVKEKYIHVD